MVEISYLVKISICFVNISHHTDGLLEAKTIYPFSSLDGCVPPYYPVSFPPPSRAAGQRGLKTGHWVWVYDQHRAEALTPKVQARKALFRRHRAAIGLDLGSPICPPPLSGLTGETTASYCAGKLLMSIRRRPPLTISHKLNEGQKGENLSSLAGPPGTLRCAALHQ